MSPIESNSKIIIAQLKECERECKEHLLPWLKDRKNGYVTKVEITALLSKLPLWKEVSVEGKSIYQHQITKIGVDFQKHRIKSLSQDQANQVVTSIWRHVRIISQNIFNVDEEWEEQVNYEIALKNFANYTTLK